MVQEVEAASALDGVESSILFCENDEERQQDLATAEKFLTEEGQGKVLSGYDKPCPTTQADKTIYRHHSCFCLHLDFCFLNSRTKRKLWDRARSVSRKH